MKTQLDKILEWAEGQLGSRKWHGYCQAFVYNAVKAGIGSHDTPASAKKARELWMKKGTSNDLNPPVGAAVYFKGTGIDGQLYGHSGLSVGNGYMINAVSTVCKVKIGKYTSGGYLGWGWQGGVIPEGASENGKAVSSISATYTSSNNDSSGNSKATVEVSTVVVKNESGSASSHSADKISNIENTSEIFLLIESGGRIYRPYVCKDIKVTRERTGAPSKMTFSCLDIDGMNILQGSAVAFRYKNKKVFFGYVFSCEYSSEGEEISVVCYDQLRYFKNKDTFVYNKTYSDLVKYICSKYNFKLGEIENTGYRIPTRVAEGSLFDICAEASKMTILNNKKNFVLYDDFGKITLKNIDNMHLPFLIDRDTSGKWSVKESIDSEVYNRIVIKQDDSETGERNLYIANDTAKQIDWGVLTMYEDGGDAKPELLKIRAAALLKYYCRENKTLKVDNVFGNTDVRGGSSFIACISFNNNKKIQNLVIVDKVEHIFSEELHTMNLNLFGGDYSA